MEIRINTLTLHNFKGVRGDRTFRFDGRNARIEGDNGTGKSTVFDAFTWLLFGKDHQGRSWTNFNIKPIDPATRETIHGLDGHWVEAELTLDGVKKTLRRVVAEDWVKPVGSTERVLKGHTQQFFIDGVATGTLKAYDLAIHQWIDEDVFRIVTNPLHFIDDRFTDWQTRRKILLAAVGYNPAAIASDFADLVAEMKGVPVEQFRKIVAAAKKDQRAAVEKASANIDAWEAALPEAQDVTAVEDAIRKLEAERDAEAERLNDLIRQTDAGIADISAAEKERRDKIISINGHILALQQGMADYTAEAVKAETGANLARLQAISEAPAKVEAAKAEYDSLAARRVSLERKVKDYQDARNDEAARLAELGRRYKAEKEAAFTADVETVCPTCGRPYPEDEVEEKREQRRAEWTEARRSAMADIQKQVPGIRSEIAAWDESIAKATAELASVADAIEAKRAELKVLDDALAQAKEAPQADISEAESRARKSDGYLALKVQADALEAEVNALSAHDSSTATLLADRRRYADDLIRNRERFEESARPHRDILAVEGERRRLLGMIDEEKARRAALTDELARLERLEMRTLDYIKASVDACEGTINALFRVARWKMFDRTLEGGLVEMCEVTTADGVPYRSMNDAMRILCGLDVIRVLSAANSVQAPIFVDNAESVTRRDFGLPAQIIRLVVKEGAELTVTAE